MESVNIRDNFPVMNGGDGVILSKRGDICVGWELTLPPAFRCNDAGYDSLLGTLSSAIALLPDYTVVHKQDVFMRKRYAAEPARGFLEEAYERHFDGREYLDHRCFLWLSFSSRKNIRGGASGILGLGTSGIPTAAVIARNLTAAEQFAAMVSGNSLWSLRRLSEGDIFGEMPGQAGHDVGVLQDYLNFTDEGADVLSDIQVAPSSIRVGNKTVVCHLFADLDQLPGEVASCKRNRELSTENSAVMLSYLDEIGQSLSCEHVVNWFCVKEPLKDIHGALDSKRRQMQSMSARNAENRKYAEEINEYLETAAVQQMSTVRCHVSIFSTDENASTTAISKLGITPVRDIANAPAQFWSVIPGNESGLAFSEYMTMELSSALCLNLYDGFDTGIPGGVLKMSDRVRLVPVRFDIQELALELGLIENYNVFLLGPSGSGKSFFMNKYLRSCYMAGQHCFLIDQGDSYRALCHIIREESGGKDGGYYTFEKGRPISFNPFRNHKRFSQADSEAMNFLFTLMVTLWKNGKAEISSSAEKYVRESITAFLRQWDSVYDPIFNDYFVFVRDEFGKYLEKENAGKEYFDLKDYLISLEQFYRGGAYDYLLNSSGNIDILNDRFVVFEIDAIKDDKIVYPITTLVIMDAFNEKMSSNSDFKVMCIEEAWKAIMGTQMATYMLELWKTARKHRTSAMVVTQELKDITSSPIIKDSIVENSGVKILLDQSKYLNRFEELARQRSLSEGDKSMVLSLNRYKTLRQAQGDRGMPGRAGHDAGREVF
ncbi:MAG: TraG family conjugative transposon ATPase, partial [Bacteroidales bacterium]|nr:TraG family conjugative transposon ATPase [Bacteroidales bacterium]